ncbi:uncharacterized protein LOC143033228 [Oratosquilla oratoria]|uniref:uncharacterized protein LOC143033228 n=1 Tax=Oratosquilla oratoria TaxID=337810 RepID=UPI003F762633
MATRPLAVTSPSILLLTLTLLLLEGNRNGPHGAHAQLGLVSSSAALVAHRPRLRNLSTNLGLLAKWGDRTRRPTTNSTASIEHEIAAIFRGVAYGATTEAPASPSTTSTTSTTTPPRTTYRTTTTTKDTRRNWVITENEEEEEEEEKVLRFLPTGGIAVGSPSSFQDPQPPSDNPERAAVHYELRRPDILLTPQTNLEDHRLRTTFSPSPTKGDDRSQRPSGNPFFYSTEYGTTEESRLWQFARVQLGAAWWVHVYSSAIVFSLLSLLALCALMRLNACSHLLPRGYFVTIQLLLFLAAFFRGVYLFHDAYNCDNKLPPPLSFLLFNTGAPCIVGALAVLVLALLRATRTSLLPPRLQTPLALATMVAFHVGLSVAADVVVGVMGSQTAPLHVVVQAVTAIWATSLCVGYVWVFSSVERSAVRQQGELVRLTFTRVHLEGGTVPRRLPRPTLSRGARLTLAAAVAQLLLVAVQLYGLIALHGPPVTPTHIWAWWTYQTISRILEICLWVIIAVVVALTQTHVVAKEVEGEQKIFSVFNSCSSSESKIGKGAEVYPTLSSKGTIRTYTIHPPGYKYDDTLALKKTPLSWSSANASATGPRPLGNRRTEQNKSSTLDSVTSDFQLMWNRDRSNSTAAFRPSSMLVNESGFVRFRTEIDPEQAMDDVLRQSSHNLHKISPGTPTSPYANVTPFSATLPGGSRYYCAPPPTADSSEKAKTPTRPAPLRPYATCKPNSRFEHFIQRSPIGLEEFKPPNTLARNSSRDNYEVAPYYTNSLKSNKSSMYSSPHATATRWHRKEGIVPTHEPIYDSASPPQHTARITSLLTPSSGNVSCSSQSEMHVDYLTDISSADGLTLEAKKGLNALTLPLQPVNSTPTPNATRPQILDITPDSAVVLDYSVTTEDDSTSCSGAEGESNTHSSGALDLLRLSTSSLNDVLKNGAGGLLGRLVGQTGYSPLHVDPKCGVSPSSNTVPLRRAASSSHLLEAESGGSQSASSPEEPNADGPNLPSCRNSDPITQL